MSRGPRPEDPGATRPTRMIREAARACPPPGEPGVTTRPGRRLGARPSARGDPGGGPPLLPLAGRPGRAGLGEPGADSGWPDGTGHPAAGGSGAGARPTTSAPEPRPSARTPEPQPSPGETPDQRPAEGASPQAGPVAGPPPGLAAGPSPGPAEEPAAAPDDEDPFGEEELRAAEQGASQAVPLDDLAGHARLTAAAAAVSRLWGSAV